MKPEESGQHLTEQRDIYRVLRSLQLSRSLLTLRFGKSRKNAFTSLLIHTDIDQQVFVIDELFPEEGNERLAKGEPFTLTSFYEGVQVLMKGNRTLPQLPQEFDHAHAIKFPRSIFHKQRRQAYRATISSRVLKSSIIAGSNERKETISGRAVDLSTSGIGCEFNGDQGIGRGEIFDHCHIIINGQLDICCSLLARHPHYDKVSDISRCGFEFQNLDRPQQKQVDRYVFELQREARKTDAHRRELASARKLKSC